MFILPDILAQWPWRRDINPLSGSQAKAESTAWILSFNAFTPRLQQALERGNNRGSHLTSLREYVILTMISYTRFALFSRISQRGKRYPRPHLIIPERKTSQYAVDIDVFRVGCDLMNWFFLYDEYSDLATPQEAQEMATITLDALYNPEKARPAGECVIGEATRQ